MTNKEIISRIYLLIKPHQAKLIIAMICMVFVSGFSAVQAYLVKPLLDEIFVNKDQTMLNLLPLGVILVFACKGIFNYLYSYLMEKTGHIIIRDVRIDLYAHIQNLPLSFFAKTPTGEMISRILIDAALMQGAVSSILVGILKDLFTVFGLLFVLFYQDWQLALISVVFLPITAIPIYKFGQKFRKYSTSSQETWADSSNILVETVRGIRIVKAFRKEKYEINRFTETMNKLCDIYLCDARLKSINHPLMELLGGIGIGAIIWYGGKHVVEGTSTPGTFFSFLTALIMIYEPIKGLSKTNNQVQHGLAAGVRLFSLIDTKSNVEEKENALELPPFQQQIKLNDIYFSYLQGEEVVRGINMTIKAGEIVALVGTSGGGKSTIADLIPRFYDVTRGSITIDDMDIRDVTFSSLRNQIAIVTQDTILFNASVKENIAYGTPDKSDREIEAAAKAAHAFDFINNLPDKFETIIGEAGSRLSGGQRQRLSIARALLKNAPILILDEATSALDTESEREVQRALGNLMAGRTTLVIAHRLSTIRNADRIMVIQKGKIVEQGSHEELLAKSGAYYNLDLLQRDTH